MDSPTLILTELPELSDESAVQCIEFLYALVNALENQYRTQLRQYYQSMPIQEPPEPDLFDGFDELPDF